MDVMQKNQQDVDKKMLTDSITLTAADTDRSGAYSVLNFT